MNIAASVLDLLPWTFSFHQDLNRLLKNAHLHRYPHPSSLRRTAKYVSLLRISGALHLSIFEQPDKNGFFQQFVKS
jgi:hypothetical protein